MNTPPNQDVAGAKRVVILDDSRTVLASARAAFSKAGFHVTIATDAQQLDPAALHRADMIVVDVNMEQAFGDDVVHFFRDVWQLSAPIYLFSTIPREELLERAKSAGADGAFCKSDGVQALVEQALALGRLTEGETGS